MDTDTDMEIIYTAQAISSFYTFVERKKTKLEWLYEGPQLLSANNWRNTLHYAR